MSIHAIIFDLDGTLLDTLDDIANAVEGALALYNMPSHPKDAYRFFVGNGIKKLVQRAVLANTPEEITQAIYEETISRYNKEWAKKTMPYTGIVELINILSSRPNMMLFILTNKPDASAKQMVDLFFPDKPFIKVQGQSKKYPAKPAPDAVFSILKEYNLHKDEVLFVGDSEVDIQTANNAGVRSVGVTWGFRPIEELKKNNATYIINKSHELLEVLV